MIPDIQSIFDSTAALDGEWFYVGKYALWTLYVTNSNDATVSVEAVSLPSNNFIGIGNPGNIGIQVNNVNNPAYQTPAPPWSASTQYALNALIVDYNGNVQKATTPGVSGSSVPTFATTGTTADGSVVWTFQAQQGSSNYIAAPKSSASPAGVVICPSMSASANLESGPTGAGYVLFTSPNAIFVPEEDLYVGYIRVRKASGGSALTTAYVCGQVDS